jgi:DNA-binding NtrC family response regulator
MPHNILIVEDDPLIRELIKSYLESMDCVVIEAEDLKTARQALQSPAPDVVMLDLRLPDGNGMGLLPEIEFNWPSTRIVVLSGYCSVDLVGLSKNQDNVLMLAKPFGGETLKKVIEKALSPLGVDKASPPGPAVQQGLAGGGISAPAEPPRASATG